jgi:hypothetical protein
MKSKIKKIIAYIFRSWDKEESYTHPGLKILPPFFLEAISYLICLSIIYQIGAYFWSLI